MQWRLGQPECTRRILAGWTSTSLAHNERKEMLRLAWTRACSGTCAGQAELFLEKLHGMAEKLNGTEPAEGSVRLNSSYLSWRKLKA